MHHPAPVFQHLIVAAILALPLAACDSSQSSGPQPLTWPIADQVFTTAEQQILPVALTADTPQIQPSDVAHYETYGYSAWRAGAGTTYGPNAQPYDQRTELAPAYAGAANAARLLSFFAMSDVHITDEESPAQPLYIGWSAKYGPSSAGLQAAYTPAILATTQVLDAAVQTINALQKKTPFDFGIFLGDDINNAQHNELRWFIDVLDGKLIIPGSGAHAGAETIDYQRPFQAAGLDQAIPWYQVIGNHDQFWMGSFYENEKTMQAHIGETVLNMEPNPDPNAGAVNRTGAYMGVVDGTTPHGEVVKAGPEAGFPTPPKVVADADRRSLATSTSSSLNWMKEFFSTTSSPVGHGFTQANLDQDFACYSFVPKTGIPIKVIVLDDTCKGAGQSNYAAACLDQSRIDWLSAELESGQEAGQLMIIAAHIPLAPQKSFTDTSTFHLTLPALEQTLLATLHATPNLLLWISGHLHRNVVTAQPDPQGVAEKGFWEVETASLRDFPQQLRTFDIRRNSDNTISIMVTNVDAAVKEGSPAAKARGYAIGAARIFGATPAVIADTASQAYNVELVKQLSAEMQAKIDALGTPLR